MGKSEKLDKIRTIVDIAQKILDARIGLMEASREIVNLCDDAMINDENIMIFRIIDSETDDLPLGVETSLLSAKSKSIIDQTRKEIEDAYNLIVKEACRKIIQKYN